MIAINLRQDPFERFAFESRTCLWWMAEVRQLSVEQVLAKLSDQQSRN